MPLQRHRAAISAKGISICATIMFQVWGIGSFMAIVGLISDTHSLLRPEAVQALAGSDAIIHAGDVGAPEILDTLRALAPLVAVRGNVDKGAWATALPATAVAEVDGTLIYVLHDLVDLDLDPAAAGFGVVVSGHSHKP